ncbi:MAG: amino acid ABC transporter ATP-binding protein [Spirochaetia bacterium]|jgi:polar amino acid transport system ATP-binding protein|nr:amino acid ABC transporter ATP-binding protein [Spirochaetia bacterium]
MIKIISMKGVCKNFGSIKALDNVDLEVSKGEVITIIGPSGSGKSTLLRSINQLEKIDSGRIEIEGEPVINISPDGIHEHIPRKQITRLNKKLGMVFQHFNLFPHKTVLENITEAPLIVNKMKLSEAENIALKLLETVGLSDKKDVYPSRISGGQKQRVAIARALGMQPDILLCDEPTSALDPELVGEVLATLRKLAREKMTMIVVTHEMAFAREISDRIIFMDEGKILADGLPDQVIGTPDHPRIREFVKKFI